MSILQFGFEERFRETSKRRRSWIPRALRPINAMARLHFLVMLRRLKALLPEGRPARILEAGTKQGHTSFWLARSYAHQVVGIDIDAAFIEQNRRLAEVLDLDNLSFIETDLTKLLNLTQLFDLIICAHVLEHIEADITALENLFEVTAPGGYLLILTPGGMECIPSFTPEELVLLDHVRPGYTLADLKQKVEQAGYQLVSGEPAFGLWGAWACQIDFNWCLRSRSLLLNGAGALLASILVFAEYWFPVRLQGDVLLVAQKEIDT